MNLDFFKRHKILSGFLILIVILIIIFLIYSISVRVGIPTERNYVTYMKGVWEPDYICALPFMAKDMKRIKDDNINTISLGPPVHVPGPINLVMKPIVLGIVKAAKKEGLAVHIAPQAMGPFPPNPDAVDKRKLEKYTARVLGWAEFSEKYGVEYFSPLSEAACCLHKDRAIEWQNKLLPELRKRFSGKIYTKWAGCDTSESIELIRASKDFDGVMFDFFPPDEKEQLEEFYIELEEKVKATSQEAKRLNLSIAIGEFAIPTSFPFAEMMPGPVVSKEKQAEFTAKYFDIVMPFYDGVIYCGWLLDESRMKGNPVEQVIKEKFAEE